MTRLPSRQPQPESVLQDLFNISQDTAGYISGDLGAISSRVSGDDNQKMYGESNPVAFMAPKLVADLGTLPAMFVVTKTGKLF